VLLILYFLRVIDGACLRLPPFPVWLMLLRVIPEIAVLCHRLGLRSDTLEQPLVAQTGVPEAILS
jgi:hypothetical protein